MATIKQHAPTAARILLGLVFFVFGLNGFLGFMPTPPHEGAAAAFLGGLGAAGYFFPLLKATEVAVGVSLLANRFVPLSLVVLAPISLNILLFHAFLEPATLAMPVVLTVLHVALAYAHREVFAPLLRAQSHAHVGTAPRVAASVSA